MRLTGVLADLGRSTAIVAVGLCLLPGVVSAETLRAAMTGALRNLDPHLTSATITKSHGYMVYDTLLSLDANFEIQPQMADFTVSDDQLTYTFTLRDGLGWHDGTPVTTADVIASLTRWMGVDPVGGQLKERLVKFEAIDDRSFVMQTDKPTQLVLQSLAKNAAPVPFILPKRLAETSTSEPITEAIGSGPFKLVAAEFRPGVATVYEKNEDYHPRSEPASWAAGGKVVNVDRVEWVVMPDAQTAINAALAGEVDYVDEPALDLLQMVEGSEEAAVQVINPFGLQILGRMNQVAGPFADVDVRRALMLGLSQEPFLSAMSPSPDFYKTCGAIFVCDTPFASDAGTEKLTTTGDLEAAKAALAASSYDGEPVKLLQVTDSNTQRPQPLVAAQVMKEIGFNVEMVPSDVQTSISYRLGYQNAVDRVWDLYFGALQSYDVANPLTNIMIRADGQGIYGAPTDPEVETARLAFINATTDAEMQTAAATLQADVIKDVIYVPLGELKIPAIVSTKTSGWVEGPSAPYFWGVSKTE